MKGILNILHSELKLLFPAFRVVVLARKKVLNIYVAGPMTSSQVAALDLCRPLGFEFRMYKMGFFQYLLFGRFSWSVHS
jgi:hypothetical protein